MPSPKPGSLCSGQRLVGVNGIKQAMKAHMACVPMPATIGLRPYNWLRENTLPAGFFVIRNPWGYRIDDSLQDALDLFRSIPGIAADILAWLSGTEDENYTLQVIHKGLGQCPLSHLAFGVLAWTFLQASE